MRPILLAEQKKSVVENTQNGPLPVLRGEKHTKPLPNLNKIKPNKSSLLKETILETNALHQSSLWVVTRPVEVTLFWIPHKSYLHP